MSSGGGSQAHESRVRSGGCREPRGRDGGAGAAQRTPFRRREPPARQGPSRTWAARGSTRGRAAPGDGWLYNLHFAEKDKGFVPLIVGQVPDKSRTSADAKMHMGRDEVMAWAHQRPEGGRGFSFTGVDLHKSWSYESQRKLVVNGILWSAGLEVPADGAATKFAETDLNRNLDKKAAPAPKTGAKPTEKKK